MKLSLVYWSNEPARWKAICRAFPDNISMTVKFKFMWESQCACLIDQSINQWINLISISPISVLKPCSMVRQPNLSSIAKLMKHFHSINGMSGVLVSNGKMPSQRDISSDISWRWQLKWLNGQTAAGCSRETGLKSEKLATNEGNEAVEHCK